MRVSRLCAGAEAVEIIAEVNVEAKSAADIEEVSGF
jgi:hypothetical protein